jgi:hypothetical protein
MSEPAATVGSVTTYQFSAPLWQYPGEGGWHFVSVPAEISDDIAELTAGTRHGFGSVPVAVTVGNSTWQTSLFPDSKTGTYLLPVKKSVRTAERLSVGGDVNAHLELTDS